MSGSYHLASLGQIWIPLVTRKLGLCEEVFYYTASTEHQWGRLLDTTLPIFGSCPQREIFPACLRVCAPSAMTTGKQGCGQAKVNIHVNWGLTVPYLLEEAWGRP
jgi:hypothetical protein